MTPAIVTCWYLYRTGGAMLHDLIPGYWDPDHHLDAPTVLSVGSHRCLYDGQDVYRVLSAGGFRPGD